jgi:hypothetical protein
MPCPSSSVGEVPNAQVTDLLFRHAFTAAVLFKPGDRPELVAAVAQAALNGRSVRAIGSNWSLSSAGVADQVIDTSALQLFLGQPFPAPAQPLPPTRIRGSGSDLLAKACSRDPQTAGRHYVHVEAGIKIKDLLADLGGCGMALRTMGDGAGQSLIGALSTATHGGDFQVSPLVEWVRAVHLVGPTGQEFWVTPKASPFGFAPLVTTLPGWCADARFVSDDDAFDAVRVGVGRMGVVYAVILEVVEQYTLLEVNLEHRWSDIRAQLTTSRITGGSPSGVFEAGVTDLDGGWFRTEVLKRTIYLDPSTHNAKFVYSPGPPKWPGVPQYFDTHPNVYVDLLSDLGLSTLAADLRGGGAMPLHHINLAISLSTPDRCWIRRRWKRASPVRALAVGPGEDDPLVGAIKANKTNPPGIVSALKDRLQIDPLLNFLGWLAHDPRKHRLDWYLDEEIDRIAAEHAKQGATSGEALFLILYRIATDPILEAADDVANAASSIIAQSFSKLARVGPASGNLHQNMLDAHDYGLDGAQSGDSAEFHFDASASQYLDFIDAVIGLAGRDSAVFGYIGIRFTPAATALIAMQQFKLTASVEVSTPRSRLEDVYAGFWNNVHAAANVRGGIAHWGQAIRQSASDLGTRYGNRLLRWRTALANLAAGGPGVFSTLFSRDKGLEPYEQVVPDPLPTMDDDSVDQFMLGLAAGDE